MLQEFIHTLAGLVDAYGYGEDFSRLVQKITLRVGEFVERPKLHDCDQPIVVQKGEDQDSAGDRLSQCRADGQVIGRNTVQTDRLLSPGGLACQSFAKADRAV